MRPPPAHPRRLLAALGLLWLALLAACAGRHPPATLPGEADLEPDRLVILLHGYVSESGAITPLFDLLNRDGVPRAWLDPLAPGHARYHTHSFDFSRFTRVGSDHNVGIEDLAAAFGRFYHALPLSCPICHHRAHQSVKVTLIARSFGGILAREFLLREEERGHLPIEDVPGELESHLPWRVNRVITLATPFYGSFSTLFARGFLSIVINGVVRTVIKGFVNPSTGGVFGNVIDAQARALRYGSIFLWRQHIRWRIVVDHLRESGEEIPRWLVMAAVGHHNPDRAGDSVTRIASANIAPNLPHAPVETFIADLKHSEFFRGDERGRRARELELASRALVRFMERGTLADDPSDAIAPWGVVDAERGAEVVPLNRQGQPVAARGPVRQTLYLQPRLTGESVSDEARKDLRHKEKRLKELFAADLGDVWLRFYDGLPGDEHEPRVLRLRRSLSLFRSGLEYSRSWADLVSETESDASGQEVPVVHSMATMRSHLITIPDLTPTGAYELGMSINVPGKARAMPIPGAAVKLSIEGEEDAPRWAGEPTGATPLIIHPYRTNLIHVYLDGRQLRALYPGVQEIDLREVWLQPAAPPDQTTGATR